MHRIRLVGPWRLSVSESEVRMTRSFNKPTGVDEQTRFSLAWRTPSQAVPTAVNLNEQTIEFRHEGGIWLAENNIILSNRNEWEIRFVPLDTLPVVVDKPVGIEHPYLCDAWLQIHD